MSKCDGEYPNKVQFMLPQINLNGTPLELMVVTLSVCFTDRRSIPQCPGLRGLDATKVGVHIGHSSSQRTPPYTYQHSLLWHLQDDVKKEKGKYEIIIINDLPAMGMRRSAPCCRQC